MATLLSELGDLSFMVDLCFVLGCGCWSIVLFPFSNNSLSFSSSFKHYSLFILSMKSYLSFLRKRYIKVSLNYPLHHICCLFRPLFGSLMLTLYSFIWSQIKARIFIIEKKKPNKTKANLNIYVALPVEISLPL